MKNYLPLIVFLLSLNISSQEYKRMIATGTYTVQEIKIEAERYFDIAGRERGKGYKPYKRWEYQALRSVDENGMLKSPAFYFNELERYNQFLNQNSENTQRSTVGNWEQLGPTSWNRTSGWNPGVGRITSIAIEQTNTNHIIVGANTGGVWKTINGGTTWTVLTDNLSNLNVFSLTIDPNNSQNYFWGSIDGIIFNSDDAGVTWNVLADTGNGRVNKILIDPNNSSKMYCSVEGGGIYKSIDSGINWTIINPLATNGYDIEFKPGNTNVIYASGNELYRSIDGGLTFSSTSFFSNFNDGPKMIGVSENDNNIIYVLEASGSIFGALYKSTNGGGSYIKLNHGSNNYFGYSSTASDNSGQAPRDMDITVNPNDANEVHIAGVLSWMSTDGGVNFNLTSQWTHTNATAANVGYCHADIDILEYVDGKLYVGSDGGIFVAENPLIIDTDYYTDLTSGLGIRQFYKIGVNQSNPEIITGGSQDNGTSVYDNTGTWKDWLGADGMESFIDKDNNNILYGTSQFGTLYKSTNLGSSYFGIPKPDGKSGSWVTPFEQDPTVQNVIYTGYDQVYKSIDGGSSWNAISQIFGGNLDELKIAPSNNNIMYTSLGSDLYKTIDGGATDWIQLTGFAGSINSIAIHPTDSNKIAIATTGAQKVYVSTDGGINWTSYLYDLPNFNASALVWQNNADNGLYLGMNYGVYYIDDTTSNSWQPYSNNLPNVIINELEINVATNKVYAGTYGRGLWKSDLFDSSLSVDEFGLNSVSMYPNPASKELNLTWNESDAVSIKIYNSIGKLIYYSKNNNLVNSLKIDISSLSSGMYFVKMNNSNTIITKKLLVK